MSFTKWILACLLCAIANVAVAQTCANCKRRPSVATFDFDVQVAKPSSQDTTDLLWPEWKALFRLSSMANIALSKANGGCIKFIIPPAFHSGDTTTLSVGGETFTNLPSNPEIGPLKDYGDYVTTGVISRNGNTINVHMELLTACSRKVVASADHQFPYEGIVGNLATLGQQIAAKLSPLVEKINDFEKRERSSNKSLSIDYFESDQIKVTPARKLLKAGETTSVTLELRDCDGTPLAGREIVFTELEFEGFKLDKTVGGVVTPSKVMTDAQGKATVQYKLNSNATEAIINAHSPGLSVRGCPDMFTGTAFLNIKAIYSGYVKYKYSNSSFCHEIGASGCLEQQYKGSQDMGIEYTASFYQEGEKSEDLNISFTGRDDPEDGSFIPNCMETGSYNHRKMEQRKHIIICKSVNQGQTYIQNIKSNSAGGLDYGSVRVSISDLSTHADLSLQFKTKENHHFSQTLLPTSNETKEDRASWDVSFDTFIEKDFKATKQKVGNKTKYTIEYSRNLNPGCNLNSTEKLQVVIWEE